MTICTEEQVAAWFPGRDATTEWQAAESYLATRVRWPESITLPDGTTMPADPPTALVQAVRILTHRYLERRSTPTGVLGMDDMGAVRLPGVDSDVERLIAPWRPVVFG